MHKIRIQNMKYISANSINSGFSHAKGGTNFFGENHTNQKYAKRYKFAYEKFDRNLKVTF